MKKMFLVVLAALSLTLAACGKQEQHVATPEEQRATALANSEKNAKLQDLLEQQRSTALSNVTVNSSIYFAANPRFDNTWKKMPHTDDQIGPACPQGSGWAWVNVMHVDGKDVQKMKLWCSTSSQSLGCYTEADFQKGPHAGEPDRCDQNLPHPLKRFTEMTHIISTENLLILLVVALTAGLLLRSALVFMTKKIIKKIGDFFTGLGL